LRWQSWGVRQKTPEKEQDADPGPELLKEQGVPPWALVEILQDEIVDGSARDASAKTADAIKIAFDKDRFPPTEAGYARTAKLHKGRRYYAYYLPAPLLR
jgi:hypothetical protein